MNDAITTALARAARYAVTPTRVRRWLREVADEPAFDARRCDGCDRDASAVGRAQRAQCAASGCACEGETTVEVVLRDGQRERARG